MCQLCTIKTLASTHRWPKPLEPHQADIAFLVDAAHEEFIKYDAERTKDKKARTALEAAMTLSIPAPPLLPSIEVKSSEPSPKNCSAEQAVELATKFRDRDYPEYIALYNTVKPPAATAQQHQAVAQQLPTRFTHLEATKKAISTAAAKLHSNEAPASLQDLLCTLSHELDVLESDREKWWTSPEKRRLRQQLEQDCNQRKLSDLHKINNGAAERVEAMVAKLGAFVKWSIGLRGGVEELMGGVD